MSKQKLTPLPTEVKAKAKKANNIKSKVLDFVNYKVLPFIAKALILIGFAWAVYDNLARFNSLPETVQGTIAALVIALVIKVATNKK